MKIYAAGVFLGPQALTESHGGSFAGSRCPYTACRLEFP